MKRFVSFLIITVLLISCQKDDSIVVPEYETGSLVEIINNRGEYLEDLICNQFEYTNNIVTARNFEYDSNLHNSFLALTSQYYFSNNRLEKVINFNHNVAGTTYVDTLFYYYSDSLILQVRYYDVLVEKNNIEVFIDTVSYHVENDKITKSGPSFLGFYDCKINYQWVGENLSCFIHYRQTLGAPKIKEYNYQYTTLDNPFFYCNIPLLEINSIFDWIETRFLNLIPKCSPHLPSKLIISFDDNYWFEKNVEWIYNFEYKLFQDAPKPYEVTVTFQQIRDGEPDRQREYFFTLNYEKK